MICPQCHSHNRDTAKFCDECGYRLEFLSAEVIEDADDVAATQELPIITTETSSETIDSETKNSEAMDSDAMESVESEAQESEQDDSSKNEETFSGVVSLAGLPVINVAGVNVDDDGKEINLDDDEDVDPEEIVDEVSDNSFDSDAINIADEDIASDMAETAVISDQSSPQSVTDEVLVGPEYVPPQRVWKAGDTMEMPRIEGRPSTDKKDFRAESTEDEAKKEKKGKNKIITVAIVCLAVLALAAGLITYQMEIWGGKVLPDVVGMTQADATYVLEEKGFAVQAEQVKSDEPEGVVLGMNPGPGARCQEGAEVVVEVAVARSIPDVVGLSKDEALKVLEEEGLKDVEIKAKKSDKAKGTVLSVSPEEGAKAKEDTAVVLTVAKPYKVPDISGMTYEEAKAAIEKEGLVAKVSYVYDEGVAEGTVMGVSPKAGKAVKKGSTVTLKVARSRGSELVEAAQSYLGSIGTINLGGVDYQIQSVDGVSYEGSNTTSFTITASAIATLDGETVHGSSKQKTGTIVWDDSNNVVSVS